METLIESLTCELSLLTGVVNGNGGGGGKSTNNLPANVYVGTHLLENPKLLPCCRRRACNKCIIKCLSSSRRMSIQSPFSDVIFGCPLCKKKTRVTLNTNGQECNLESDLVAQAEYEKNIVDLNHYLIRKLEVGVKNIEGKRTLLYPTLTLNPQTQ